MMNETLQARKMIERIFYHIKDLSLHNIDYVITQLLLKMEVIDLESANTISEILVFIHFLFYF